jgi:hypothetical protein
MRNAVKLAAFAACAALVTFGAAANAQQLDHPRTDYAAYTRPKGTLAVGPIKVEHGIIDEIMVGTYVPPWFAFPVLKVPIPSVYAKFRTSWWDPVTLSLRADVAYVSGTAIAELKDENASASGVSTTGDIAASWRIDERWSATLALDYARLRAIGESKDEAASVEGASTADTYSVRAFGEWRLTRVFAVTLLFRYLVYQSPISVDSTSESDSVSVDADLSAEGAVQKRFSITPGVSFVWDHWELSGGVGYGVFYLPLLGLASAKSYPLIDFAAAYRFDLY